MICWGRGTRNFSKKADCSLLKFNLLFGASAGGLCDNVWNFCFYFCRHLRGIYLNRFPGEFCGGFLVESLGHFPWKNRRKQIHPKIHGKIQIRIWELRGQNPHCRDLAVAQCLLLESSWTSWSGGPVRVLKEAMAKLRFD